MRPQPPQYGSGPVNYTGEAGASPYGPGDNSINYQNMARYQSVAQYQPTQYNLPQQMQRQILTDPRYSYGVPGGQNKSYYNRQAELTRSAYSSAISSGAINAGAWAAASVPFAMAGLAGMSVALPAMVLTAPITGMISKRVSENLERQKYTHSIASDLEQHRETLGMRGLTYSQATTAGARLGDYMLSGKKDGGASGFFNKEQMMKVHKIGVSEGMLGTKSGSIREYEKNVKELMTATEDVVKVLQTTVEGGMSLMKEVNQIGFKSLPQIKSQIRSAKAIGASTGIGTQNALSIGAAGAQAVQGTPWKASVGASMYQMGAVNAHAVASSSTRGAYAVERAGGVAQAGGVIANASMNILQSGLGTRMAAYAMNPDGTTNRGRMDALLSGNVKNYEIVSGANRTGYKMGANRVRFDMFKSDMLNEMSDMDRAQMTRVGFNEWRRGRGGGALNQAYAFAGQYTSNSNDRRLMYEKLIGPSGVGNIVATARAQDFSAATGRASNAPKGWLSKAFGAIGRGSYAVVGGLTDATTNVVGWTGGQVANAVNGIVRGVFDATNTALRVVGGDKYGLMDRKVNYGDMNRAAMISTGAIMPADTIAKFRRMRIATKNFTDFSGTEAAPTVSTGIDINKMKGSDPEEVQLVLQKLNALATGYSDEPISKIIGDDNNFQRATGLKPSRAKKWGYSEVTSAYNQIVNNVVKPKIKRFNNLRKDYEKQGFMKDPRFQDAYEDVNDALYASGKEDEGTALRRVRDKHSENYFYASRAETYALQKREAKEMEKVKTVAIPQYDVEGKRAEIKRAYAKNAPMGEGGGGFIPLSIQMLGTNMASKRILDKGTAIDEKNIAKHFDKTLAFYEDARERIDSGVDLGEKDGERYKILKKNESFQNALVELGKLSTMETKNVANRVSEMYKPFAKKGKGFTGDDLISAMKNKKTLASFIDKNAGQFQMEADVMKAVVMEGKGSINEMSDAFLSLATSGKVGKESESNAQIYGRLSKDFNLLKTQRDQLLKVTKSKGKKKEIREDFSKDSGAIASELALLQTKMALDSQGTNSGNSASVSTPILNYWNNRWVL